MADARVRTRPARCLLPLMLVALVALGAAPGRAQDPTTANTTPDATQVAPTGAAPESTQPEDPAQLKDPVLPQDPTAAPKVPGAQAKPGPTLIGIVIVGRRRYTEEQIIAALGVRVGQPYDPLAVQKGQDTLWQAFNARVSKVDLREAAGGVELQITLEEMNVDLEPRFVGYKEMDLEDLKRWALLEDRGELYLYQSERVRQRLIEGYRREGFAWVEVDVVRRGTETGEDPSGALPDVIFEIREGPRVHVQDVVVTGNDTMPETGMWWWKGGIKSLAKVELGGPWLFDWNGEEYVREKLDADLLFVVIELHDRGWLDAVVELDHYEFSDDRSEVTVHVIVDEGLPYTVESLDIEAVDRTWNTAAQDWDEKPADFLIPKEEILELLEMEKGQKYERFVQTRDSIAIRDRYGKDGYVSHPSLRADGFEFIEPRLVFDPVNHKVAVTYRIVQGKKRWIREVLIRGTTHTRDRVVRREVDVLPGDVADTTRIRRSLGQIFSTGYFNDQMNPLEHRDPTFTFKAAPDPSWVDLEYQVEEGTVVNFQIQGGVDSNSGLFGRISLSMTNADVAAPPESLWTVFADVYDKTAFHGAGQRIDLEYMPGTIENSYNIRFLEPDLFRTHFDRWSIEFQLRRWERTQRFYDETRFDKKIRLGREFGRQFAMFMGYRFTDVTVDDLQAEDAAPVPPNPTAFPPSIYEQLGTQQIFGPTLDFTLRKLDKFLGPSEGVQVLWSNGLYGESFGSDFNYVSSDIDVDWFFLTKKSGAEVRPGFHIGLGLALADEYGDTADVPYTERFFLGGSRQMRGFAYRGVGPNLGPNALGGETSLDGTIEYRMPLYTSVQPGTYKEIEMFRLTLFTDAGILDPEPYSIDWSELRLSVGFSLGMVSPFPVTLNFGFPLVKGEGDREQVFSFSIFSLAF